MSNSASSNITDFFKKRVSVSLVVEVLLMFELCSKVKRFFIVIVPFLFFTVSLVTFAIYIPEPCFSGASSNETPSYTAVSAHLFNFKQKGWCSEFFINGSFLLNNYGIGCGIPVIGKL